jgi:flavin reductase (DIM6/NTAB) family NADH-FMN oxidoreductase RutF
MMSNQHIFRQAWGKFATGVTVVTTVRPDGEIHGMTANGICSVSLDPLMALVCAGHHTASHPLIKESGRFTINILSLEQQSIAEYFARPSEKKTGDVDVSFTISPHGGAIVDGSLAHMDCHVVAETVAGDHTVFIGEVDQLDAGSGDPLIFFEGTFGQLAGADV